MGDAFQVVAQAADEDFIALLIARNRCGPNLPIAELLHRHSIPKDAFEQAMESPLFTETIKRHVKELTANGFGVEQKAAILHEAGTPIVYDILRDPDSPAMARLKAYEMLGDVAGKSKKAVAAIAGTANGYQLVINIGQNPPVEIKGMTVEQIAEDPVITIPEEDEPLPLLHPSAAPDEEVSLFDS